jgi:hypothetical protein
MRVILVLIAGALALPAFAGSPPPEVTLPDTHAEAVESTPRAGDACGPTTPAEAIADDPAAKDHNNECDEPDGPPCEGGG